MSKPSTISVRQYRVTAVTTAVIAHLLIGVFCAVVAGGLLALLWRPLAHWHHLHGLWGVSWRFGLIYGVSYALCYGIPAVREKWNPAPEDLIVCSHDDDEDDDTPQLRPATV